MATDSASSMQRVLAALSHEDADRVPLFLLLTMHGARELGLTIEQYFARAENVVEGQIRMRRRYGHDCYYPFFYASLEVEAWGGETLFVRDGPPNAAAPIVTAEAIPSLEPPPIQQSPGLTRALRAIEGLKAAAREEVPIIGVVMSPFSLPVMQMGFERYLDLLLEQPELHERLMGVNEEFCVQWANAQLDAGATAICYFDPMSSTTVIPRETYLRTGYQVACRTLARIQGPTATHLASGRCLAIVDDLAGTGTAAVGVSADEDLAELKAGCRGRLTVLGNLNGVAMRRWTPRQAEEEVKAALEKAAGGGGFILSDNHGEIPWQVPETILDAVSAAARRWGGLPRTG